MKKKFCLFVVAVLAVLSNASTVLAVNPWDTMFTDAGTAIGALGTSATTLMGLVFAGIVLLFVGFKLVKRIANKV